MKTLTFPQSEGRRNFAVVRVGGLSRALVAINSAVPPCLVKWWRGAVLLVKLDAPELKLTPSSRRFCRLEIEAGKAFAITRQMELPNEALSDLRPAVELFIKIHTPFSPAELVIVAQERLGKAGDARTAYDLTLVPRAPLLEALSRQSIDLWKTRSIRVVDEQQRIDPVDISFAFLPFLTTRRWCAVLPFVVIMLTAAIGSGMQMSVRHDVEVSLQAMLDREVRTLSALSTEVDKKQGAIAEALASSQVLGSKFSLFDRLLRLRKVLPPDVEVLAFEQRGDVTRLSVRSSDILGTVKHLSQEAHWYAAVDGVIAAGQANGLESAVITLSPEAG